MKRAIALHAGVFGLFASAASANTCFSTGPLENEASNASTEAFVKVLNNSPTGSVTASLLAFDLNGAKEPIPVEFNDFEVGPQSSEFTVVVVGEVAQFEIQVKLVGPASDQTLLGVFGKTTDDPTALNPPTALCIRSWPR
jgi:hypothetical protein